jgi:uncharacterized protein (TIGR03083 family)
MDRAHHLSALRGSGELLAVAAERAGLDAAIPTCPGWRMRDLVRHIGDVHRWAAAHLAERRTEPIQDIAEIAGPLPPDNHLLRWFRHGHTSLLDTLERADPDVRCWAFLPAPSPLAFWARRQAHETAIHRVDAEGAGGAVTPFEPDFAVDGIEEMLFGFLTKGRLRGPSGSGPNRTLSMGATDTGGEWLVRFEPKRFDVRRGHEGADCSVRGSASDLYRLVWNRLHPDHLDVQGDPAVLGLWRESVQVTWGRDR